jgi:tetratricopeptide (TPR) repeat protein
MNTKMKVSSPDDELLIQRALMKAHTGSELERSDFKEKQKLLDLEKKSKVKKTAFEKGCKILIAEIEKHAVDGMINSSDDEEPLPVNQFKMSEQVNSTIDCLEFWTSYINKPSDLQSLLGYSDAQVLSLYRIATGFYEAQHYQDSVDSFTFLCMLNPEISGFWFALGLALEGNNDCSQAIDAYENSILLYQTDFKPYLGLIRCSEILKDFNKVTELLQKACESSDIKNHAKEALEYLSSVSK